MPRSQQPVDGEVLIIKDILEHEYDHVLDVGCGDGKWYELLKDRVLNIDGIEVWKPYIEKYFLQDKYDRVYEVDARDFHLYSVYDCIIFGDVLEHLEHKDAIELLDRITTTIYLIIPISKCEQDGSAYKNPYETHRYQWTDAELRQLGFKLLHVGTNPNGLVKIGTYVRRYE